MHSDDITELRFHPSQAPNILLSGSTDGLVNVYDTRIAEEDDVVVQTLNCGSVHQAAFLSASEVFTLSHDEKFAVFNLDEEYEKGSPVADFGDVRNELECQYVANVTTKTDGSGAIVGVGSQRYVECPLAAVLCTDIVPAVVRTSSWCTSREAARRTAGCSTRLQALGCPAGTARKLSVHSASTTTSRSYSRRARTETSRPGGLISCLQLMNNPRRDATAAAVESSATCLSATVYSFSGLCALDPFDLSGTPKILRPGGRLHALL